MVLLEVVQNTTFTFTCHVTLSLSYCLKTLKYEYRWADSIQITKPIEVSVPKYVEYLMDWIECQLDDESIFPQNIGKVLSLIYFP